jgi:hypothetical protein
MRPKNIVINTLSLLSKLTGIGKYSFETCESLTQRCVHDDINAYYYGYYDKMIYMMDNPPCVFVLFDFAKDIFNRKQARFNKR